MLAHLAGGIRVPAGELARTAGVAASTASEHLRVLTEAGLVTSERLGRHRYYSLAGPDVARAIEALQAIAPGMPVRSLRQDRIGRRLRAGRTCYDHLAGDLGLRVTDLLIASGTLPPLAANQSVARPDAVPDNEVARALELVAAPGGRRAWARGCLDWSGRRPHVAGAVGAQVLGWFDQNGWIGRISGTRAVRLTAAGDAALSALERAASSSPGPARS